MWGLCVTLFDLVLKSSTCVNVSHKKCEHATNDNFLGHFEHLPLQPFRTFDIDAIIIICSLFAIMASIKMHTQNYGTKFSGVRNISEIHIFGMCFTMKIDHRITFPAWLTTNFANTAIQWYRCVGKHQTKKQGKPTCL